MGVEWYPHVPDKSFLQSERERWPASQGNDRPGAGIGDLVHCWVALRMQGLSIRCSPFIFPCSCQVTIWLIAT